MNRNLSDNKYFDAFREQIEQTEDINIIKTLAINQLESYKKQSDILMYYEYIIDNLNKIIDSKNKIIDSLQNPGHSYMFNTPNDFPPGGAIEKRYMEATDYHRYNSDFETRKASIKELIDLHKQRDEEMRERERIKRMIDSL